MTNNKNRRKINLIKPRLQFKLIGVFVGLSALGFLMQCLHVAMRLSETAASMPEGGSHLMALMPELPVEILIFSFGMFLPLITAIGVLVTFRIAGPVYRFEQYLKSVIAGEQLGPCKLRKGDELLELCELINEATAPIRRKHAELREESEENTETAVVEPLLRDAG